jgi:hypothetical protein
MIEYTPPDLASSASLLEPGSRLGNVVGQTIAPGQIQGEAVIRKLRKT